MIHLRKFNEATEESVTFKNTDEDIQLFFTDYTDENPKALKITHGLVYDGEFKSDTTYMIDTSKYRRWLTTEESDNILKRLTKDNTKEIYLELYNKIK